MGKQVFELLDYCGPIVVGLVFAVSLFFISFFFINYFCITKYDDLTKFETFGGKFNLRLGPHSLTTIQRGGYVLREDVDNDLENEN